MEAILLNYTYTSVQPYHILSSSDPAPNQPPISIQQICIIPYHSITMIAFVSQTSSHLTTKYPIYQSLNHSTKQPTPPPSTQPKQQGYLFFLVVFSLISKCMQPLTTLDIYFFYIYYFQDISLLLLFFFFFLSCVSYTFCNLYYVYIYIYVCVFVYLFVKMLYRNYLTTHRSPFFTTKLKKK